MTFKRTDGATHMTIQKHKLPKKSPTAGAARTDATVSIHGEPSMVYDLTGSMAISLPAPWRTLIGKVAFEECLAELRSPAPGRTV